MPGLACPLQGMYCYSLWRHLCPVMSHQLLCLLFSFLTCFSAPFLNFFHITTHTRSQSLKWPRTICFLAPLCGTPGPLMKPSHSMMTRFCDLPLMTLCCGNGMTSFTCQSRTHIILFSPNPLLASSQTLPRGALFEAPVIFNLCASNSSRVTLSMPTIQIISDRAQVIIPPAPFVITESPPLTYSSHALNPGSSIYDVALSLGTTPTSL